jgi:uncharacterized RDD family membrane protein YckC
MNERKVTVGIRLASMLVDHFAMTVICSIFMLLVFGITAIIIQIDNKHWIVTTIIIFLAMTTFSIYLNKDSIKGQSPAKRILNLQVVDNKTGEIASPLKCLIRNLILPIWLIEIIFVIINPKRRLGDLIAGTRIENTNSELKSALKIKEILLSIFIGTIYLIGVFLLYFWATIGLDKLPFDIFK